jgi:hypothetical protein
VTIDVLSGMTEPERVELTRLIKAPSHRIFEIISDPNGHVAIDGSGMLISAPDASVVTKVGDKFLINMDREPLGDVPMGKYQVENVVVIFEPDREFAWGVGGAGKKPFGHIYGFRLDSISDIETKVIHYIDWSGISDDVKGVSQGKWPIVPVEMLTKTLENLDRISTSNR